MSTKPRQQDRVDHPDAHRSLPHSLDAERGMLGSMLISPTGVIGEYVEAGASPRWFYLAAHATIFEILVQRWEKQAPVDLIIVTQILRDRAKLDEVGGPAFVSHLMAFTPTAANAAHYAGIVRGKFRQREIIATCTEKAALAYEEMDEEASAALLDETEKGVLAIRNEMEVEVTEKDIRDHVGEAIEAIEHLYEHRGQVAGLATGFRDFDRLTGGLGPKKVYVVAARPSMGKSSWAMNVAEHVGANLQQDVGIFSLEDSAEEYTQRLLCSRARVNLQKVRDGFLSERDFPNLTMAASKIGASRIHLDDRGGLKLSQIRAKARRWKKQHGIRLLIVDYLQLIKGDSRRGRDDRQLEVAEISAGLKELAKELAIPVLVLAQLNRKAEDRQGGKPRLSDLRESGSIEQDADLVGLLVREEYYAADEKAREECEGQAELIIAKQRSGPTGTVELTFLKEFTRFEDRAGNTETAAAKVGEPLPFD